MIEIPADLADFLSRLDEFIEREITPLEEENIEFFDHRREWRRTDWEHDGVHRREWLELLGEMRRRADGRGFYRYALPRSMGGLDGTNLGMAVIRDHLAAKGLGLHNDLQTESSVVGNLVFPLILEHFGTTSRSSGSWPGRSPARPGSASTSPSQITARRHVARDPRRQRREDWVINGAKRFASGAGIVQHAIVFARTSGEPGDALGITAFIVDTSDPGYEIPYFHWTFNMPTDHAEVVLSDVRVPHNAILGEEGRGLQTALFFVHENRIRQAASGVGVADFCVRESVDYAKQRITFGKPLAERQAIQWPLVELATDVALLRTFIRATAAEMDSGDGSVASATGCRCATTAPIASPATPPTARCRSTAASVTRARSRSSTSTAIIAATGSPRARRRCRSATWPATCSDSSAAEPARSPGMNRGELRTTNSN